MQELSLIQRVVIWALPILFAITVHETAHGWAAKRLGDPTAQRLGRLTLNPLKHIDPVGTILVPGLLLFFSPIIFGWAKPVPVTWENLRHPKRDMALVAVAGPASNLLMALFWAGFIKIGTVLPAAAQAVALPMVYMGSAGVVINIVLMVLNLLPIPPLDGGRVLSGLLPDPLAWQLGRLERYGMFILLGLVLTGLLGRIIGPPIYSIVGAISAGFGIPLWL